MLKVEDKIGFQKNAEMQILDNDYSEDKFEEEWHKLRKKSVIETQKIMDAFPLQKESKKDEKMLYEKH